MPRRSPSSSSERQRRECSDRCVCRPEDRGRNPRPDRWRALMPRSGNCRLPRPDGRSSTRLLTCPRRPVSPESPHRSGTVRQGDGRGRPGLRRGGHCPADAVPRCLADGPLARWRTERGDAVKALSALPPAQMVPWVARQIPASALACAGLMELFAHGQDIADTIGAPASTPTGSGTWPGSARAIVILPTWCAASRLPTSSSGTSSRPLPGSSGSSARPMLRTG